MNALPAPLRENFELRGGGARYVLGNFNSITGLALQAAPPGRVEVTLQLD